MAADAPMPAVTTETETAASIPAQPLSVQEISSITYVGTDAYPERLITISDYNLQNGDIILVPLTDNSPEVDDPYFKKFTVSPITAPIYYKYLTEMRKIADASIPVDIKEKEGLREVDGRTYVMIDNTSYECLKRRFRDNKVYRVQVLSFGESRYSELITGDVDVAIETNYNRIMGSSRSRG